MGLFSFLGGIAKGFGRAVGTGVEWLGEVTGIQGIKNFGQGLKDLCADEISTENTFRKSRTSLNVAVENSKRISTNLIDFEDITEKQHCLSASQLFMIVLQQCM